MPPPAALPPPEPADEAPETTTEKVPPFDADDGTVVYGYLGKRPIIGRVSPKDGRWSGTFRFPGKREPFTIGGPAHEREPEEDEPEPMYDGREHHRYLDCELDVGGSGVTGSLSASCLHEEDTVEITGHFSPTVPKGAPELAGEPFFVRTAENEADQARYYAVLSGTPTEPRRCAPFAEVVERTSRPSDRAALLYTLRWPCEETPETLQARFGAPEAPSVQRRAYVAEVTDEDPPKLVSSVEWTTVSDPDDANEIAMKLRVFDFVPGVDLYAATLSDDFQSPTSSGGNSSVSTVVWGATADGRYGSRLELPAAESGHAGVCYQVSNVQELWLVDLEGSPTPELVSRMTEEGMTDKVVKGQHECAPTRPVVSFKVYAFEPNALTWQPRPSPKTLSERRLSSGRKLDVF